VADPDPIEEYPRPLRPFVRRGWIASFRGDRPPDTFDRLAHGLDPFLPYMWPLALVAIVLAPAILTFLVVRWVLRKIGAWE
jgi:hypothetical protein